MAPFPKHPGIAACCLEEGLERKLCLAALKHPAKEFPTYVEPSNEEVCGVFAEDPRGFQDRYLYEYSTDYSCAPLPVLAASAMSYLAMVAKCCAPGASAFCFITEKLNRKPLVRLTLVSNKACSRYDLLGKEKTKLSFIIKFAQKSTEASFEDVLTLATDASEVLSRTCHSVANDTFQRELLEHTTKICSKLAAKDRRFGDCCASTNKMDAYFCMYSLPWAKPPHLPDFQKPTDDIICTQNFTQARKRYLFEIARRYTNAPEALFTAIDESAKHILANCCSDINPQACFAAKRPQMRKQIANLLEKGNELCSEYTNTTFLDFKKKLRETYSKTLPEATEESISELVERRASFASTCCYSNAPPVYCGLQIKLGVYHPCSQDVCLLD